MHARFVALFALLFSALVAGGALAQNDVTLILALPHVAAQDSDDARQPWFTPRSTRRDIAASPPRTSVGLPATLLTLGAATMLVGGGVYAAMAPKQYCETYGSREECEDEFPIADSVGKGLMIGGAVVSLVGLVVLPVRLVARARERASQRWTDRASLSPWMPSHGKNGTKMGLSGELAF